MINYNKIKYRRLWIGLITFAVITAMVCQEICWAEPCQSKVAALAAGSIFEFIERNSDDKGEEALKEKKNKSDLLEFYLNRTVKSNFVFEPDDELRQSLKGFFEVKGDVPAERDRRILNVVLDGREAKLYFFKTPLSKIDPSIGIRNQKDLDLANKRRYWLEFDRPVWVKAVRVLHERDEGKNTIRLYDEKEGTFLYRARAKYGDKVYIAKYTYSKDREDSYLVPQAQILDYAKRKGIPGIVKAEHFLELQDGRKVILLEDLTEYGGGDLLDYIEATDLVDLAESIDIMLNLCRIIRTLHEHGIYHWEIKPESVWITRTGNVKLFDFDIAFRSEEEFLDRKLYGDGTPSYFSQRRYGLIEEHSFEDIQKSIFVNSEIYSIAMILLEMFIATEEIDLERDTPAGYINPYLDQVKQASEIPQGIKDILEHALRDGICTYDNLDNFIRELEACQETLSGRRTESGQPEDSGRIADDDELIKEFQTALDKGRIETEAVEDEMPLTLPLSLGERGRVRGLSGLVLEIIDRGGLDEDERGALEKLVAEIDGYKIELFDGFRWVRGTDSFVLGWHDRKGRRILIAKKLYNMMKEDGLVKKDLFIHELICGTLRELYRSKGQDPMRGHYRAIEIQQKLVPEDYSEGEFVERGGYRYILDNTQPDHIARDKEGREKLLKGRLGRLLRRVIDDTFGAVKIFALALLDVMGEDALRAPFIEGKMDFLLEDSVFGVSGRIFSDRQAPERIKGRKSYRELRKSSYYAEKIAGFAKAVLDNEEFRGKKILVLGRAGDLIYDALYGLAHMVPEYRDRIPDIILMDYSRKMPQTFKKIDPKILTEYIEAQGIDRDKGVVIVDEIGYGECEENYVLLLKRLLVNAGYPDGKVRTALMHKIERIGGAIGIEDFVYSDMFYEFSKWEDRNRVVNTADWLAYNYESGRDYKVHTVSGELRIEYQYEGGEDYYHLSRFYYKCRIYREIYERYVKPRKRTGSGLNEPAREVLIAA